MKFSDRCCQIAIVSTSYTVRGSARGLRGGWRLVRDDRLGVFDDTSILKMTWVCGA